LGSQQVLIAYQISLFASSVMGVIFGKVAAEAYSHVPVMGA
jgi:hypothetical protein